MRPFTLQFADDGLGEPKSITFDSDDGHEAFTILGYEKTGRRVSLYDGNMLLAHLKRTSEDGWEVD